MKVEMRVRLDRRVSRRDGDSGCTAYPQMNFGSGSQTPLRGAEGGPGLETMLCGRRAQRLSLGWLKFGAKFWVMGASVLMVPLNQN